MMNVKPSHERRSDRFVAPARILLVLAAFACMLAQARQTPTPQERGGVDWIFVLDTSASMRGAGGTRDIFNQVKGALNEFIRSTREGDSVAVYSFDRNAQLRAAVNIAEESDRRDLLNIVNELQANGDRTHTGQAISEALKRASNLAGRENAGARTVSIVLLTDGLEDVKGIEPHVSIPSTVSLIPKKKPYVFYVSLGEDVERKIGQTLGPALGDRYREKRSTSSADIAKLADEIRPVVEKPPPPTPPPTPTPAPTPVRVELAVEPKALDFGEVEPGETTGSQTLKIVSTADARVSLALEGAAGDEVRLVEPGGPVAVKAGEEASVGVRLAVAENAADGARTLSLVLTPRSERPDAVLTPASVGAGVGVKHVPLWRRLLKWLALALLALLILVAAYSLYKGDTPWGLWGRWRERNFLEGELEVIRPAPPQPEDGFVSLARLRSERLALSTVVPGGATADSDAVLSTLYKNGAKLVRLERTQGVVRVNQAEVAVADLYDSDLIELGDARLRFNWVGHERPAAADDGL